MKIRVILYLSMIVLELKGQNDGLQVQVLASDISCAGKTDGQLELVLASGMLPVDFSWINLLNGAQGIGQLSGIQQPLVLAALPAGDYRFQFTAADGADSTVQIQVLEPAPLHATLVLPQQHLGYHLHCADSRDGAVSANPMGGTGALSITWSNGDIGLSADSLSAGVVSMTMTDANGCSFETTATLFAPPAITSTISAIGETCLGLNSGQISVESVSGGIPPYWFALNANPPAQLMQWTDLPPGPYFLTIGDAAGCIRQEGVVLPAGPAFTLDLNLDTTLLTGDTLRLPYPSDPAVDTLVWIPSLGVQALPTKETLLFPPFSTSYHLTAITEQGCQATGVVRVEVSRRREVYIPNVVALHALQAENRSLTVFGSAGIRQVNLLQVYDRFGRLWFENRNFPANDPASGWFGSNGAEDAPPGVYLWRAVLQYTDGREVRLQGDVTVIR